ncbi:MAG: hypothetical protein M0R46_07085 [Candidatus Muirbacterium halophilum]|nr:hypothetical protein [Candidatus Muirbacterium halophilum]MCK9475663.1 hypothetical protein [Candidatus Muirbacterium halophilum]
MKKISLLIVSIIFCITVFSDTYNFEDKGKNLFDDAVSNYKNKNLYQSKDLFKQIISEVPDSDFARQSYFYLGKINNELSKELEKESIEYFSKTSLIYSKNDVGLEALLENAKLYKENNNIEELGRVYNKIISEFPSHYKSENIYFLYFDYLTFFEEKENLFFKYIDNFNESLRASAFYSKMFENYVLTGSTKKAERIFDYTEKENISKKTLETYYTNTKELKKLYQLIKDNDKKVLDFNKRLYNINEIEKTYEKVISNDNDTALLFEFVDFLIANNNYDKASEVIEKNMYSVNEEQRPAFMLKVGIIQNKAKYYMSEDGKTYVKDVSDIIKAKTKFEEIIIEHKNSEIIPQTLYEIILIEKDHLFNWNNLKEKAQILIKDYSESIQAKQAKNILKKYRL